MLGLDGSRHPAVQAPAKSQQGEMSALGQKQTFAVQNGMSALPPKADMCSASAHVRFVPIADIVLIRHFIGARQANGWSRFANCCPAAPHPRQEPAGAQSCIARK